MGSPDFQENVRVHGSPLQASFYSLATVSGSVSDHLIVDCVAPTRYLPTPLLACQNSGHWCAVGGSFERLWMAKSGQAGFGHTLYEIEGHNANDIGNSLHEGVMPPGQVLCHRSVRP